MMSDYKIRQYRPKDKDDFLCLYETVMGDNKSEDWFEWKYEKNPYTDHVPMMVGVNQGDIVGARPFFSLPVRISEDHEVALQPGDTMVHPDHRRQGLFTRMTERSIERYSEKHPFFFNFPNNRSCPGYLKLGWEVVSKRSSYYRIENPKNVAQAQTDRDVVQLISKIAKPVTKGYHRFRDWTLSEDSDITVKTRSEPPVELLESLYQNSIPDRIHVRRDRQFYQWRLENPDWKYTTYIANDKRKPVAAIITGTSADLSLKTTKIIDVIPLENQSEPALVSLINNILTDYPKTDLFVAPAQGIPKSILRSFGFHSDSTPPLSLVASETTHVVRTLTNEWEQNGQDITDQENWLMTHLEEDTS